jgi:hypothetical protein
MTLESSPYFCQSLFNTDTSKNVSRWIVSRDTMRSQTNIVSFFEISAISVLSLSSPPKIMLFLSKGSAL